MKLLKFLKGIILPLLTVLKHLFKPSVTLQYPEEKPILPEKFRGCHTLENCIGCGICVQSCPCQAITIEKDGNKVVSYKIDLGRCMFCGNCQYYCPVSAIKMGNDFELAKENHSDLMVELVKEPKSEEETDK